MSIAVNPLMHWAADPSPTFRIYCTTEERSRDFRYHNKAVFGRDAWLLGFLG
jgi:hypothetical protein